MRKSRIFALLSAMACTFCIAGSGLAEATSTASALAHRDVLQTESRPAGFGKIHLSGIHERVLIPGPAQAAFSGPSPEQRGPKPEVSRILLVLESRIGDPKLIEKAEYKLLKMSDSRLHLAASLSERAAYPGTDAKTDIAFFLLTTLIVFS